MKTAIIIPSRLSATRLPGKPLLKINGLSMISHVVEKAKKANIGKVYVATEDKEIVEDVEKNGGQAILTSNTHKSGTDRVCEALSKIKDTRPDLVMNLQSDEPLINIEDIKNLNDLMIKSNSKFGTLGSNIQNEEFHENKNVVKVLTKQNLNISEFSEALNFTRDSLKNYENVYHHLGIYCYQVETLKKFVSFDQSKNEISNSLEQLRAMDNNITINVALAKSTPKGVDTLEDFVAIKKLMEYKSK